MPEDGGILSDYSFENKEKICKKYPLARSCLKPFIGAKELYIIKKDIVFGKGYFT